METENIIAICKKTGKPVLMELGKECICLHKKTRKEELKQMEEFIKQ